MKLKYIIAAIASAAIFTGCQTEPMVGSFTDFSVDKTFVSIDMAGGSSDVTITAADAWEVTRHFDTGKTETDENGKKNKIYDYAPAWITLSATNGAAGESKLTITAAASESGREAELQIKSGDKLQHIVVRQGSLSPVEGTCAEANAAPVGKNMTVTGKVVEWYSNAEQYGNFYIEDETGKMLVYGLEDKNGKLKNYPIASWGIELGDVITVSGAMGEYKGDPQMNNAKCKKLVKALLGINKVEPSTVAAGGADVKVVVTYKGKGVYYAIDEADAVWISYKEAKFAAGIPTIFEKNPADTVVYTFAVAPNTGGSRTGKISFTSSSLDDENKPISTTLPVTISQEPYEIKPLTVAEAIAAIEAGGGKAEGQYVKGIISDIRFTFSASFGTATFWISEDGTAHGVSADHKSTTEPTKDFMAYSVLYYGGEKWADGNTQIKVGDEVVLYGEIVKYGTDNPVYETASQKAWIYSLNGATE